MKTGTLLRLFFILIFLGACSRNPLGEDLKQPILNLAFFLTQSCDNTTDQDSVYSCQITTNEVVDSVTFSFDTLLTTCTWASIDPVSGVVSGNPNDNQVGVCQMVVNASNQFRSSPSYTYNVQVDNLPSSLTIANAAAITEDDPATVIRTDADVQAGEEGFGLYSFDNAGTTAPACANNAAVLSIDANTGAITFGPALNFAGVCNIRVAFDDGNGAANSVVTSEFSIAVNGINDAPLLLPIAAQTTPEDIPLVLNFTVSDPDDIITCAGSMSATTTDGSIVPAGNVVFSGAVPNCIATITPVLNSSGSLSLTFTVTDTGFPVMTASQTFNLTVTPVNDPPLIGAIAAQSTPEDTPIAINFTINDPDSAVTCAGSVTAATSDALLVSVPGVVFSGAVPNCTATVTPVGNANGTVALTFTVDDGSLSDSETFNLTVTPVNDAPVIGAILAQTTAEDTAFAVNFTIDDVDSPMDCTSSVAAATSNASIVTVPNIIFSGTAPNCTATIAPVPDANGTLTLTFTVTDTLLTDAESFNLSVTPVNDAPIIGSIAAQTTPEDTPLAVNFTIDDVDSPITCAASVTATSSDAAIVTVPNVVFSGVAPNCTATITPETDANGVLNLTFTLSDGFLSDAETFSLTVSPVNDAPVIDPIAAQSTPEDTPLTVNFNIDDVDSTLSCATSVSAATSDALIVPAGSIVFGGTFPNCTATVSPLLNATGVVSLTFTVTDGFLTDAETFNLNVTPVNDPPVIDPILAQTTAEDTPIAISFTVADPDSVITCAGSVVATTSDASVVNVAGVVFSGTVPNCIATVTPVADASGTVNLTFTASDTLLTDAETFSLTVTPVNDAPVLPVIGAHSVSEDGVLTVNFSTSDVDSLITCGASVTAATSDPLIITVPGIVFSGTIPNCVATVTPLADANGSLNLTFTTDDGLLSTSQSFAVTVNPVNDAPVLSVIGAQTTPENSSLVVNFTADDIDSLISCSAVNLSATSSDGVLMPPASIVFGGAVPNCTATFTPAANSFGTSNITIRVDDNGLPNLQDTEAFVLTVTPFNDPPTISAIGPQSTVEDTAFTVNFTINDIDDILSCNTSLSATTSDGSLIAVGGVVFGGAFPNCTATVTPVLDATGVVNLTITVSDTGVPIKSDAETFAVTITPANDAPVISPIVAQTTAEDTPLIVNYTINDVDSVLTCGGSVSAATSDGTIVALAGVAFGGAYPNCTATITPVLDATGIVSLTFTVTDGSLSDAESFNLTVTPVNDAPVIGLIGAQSTAEDTQLVVSFTIDDVDSPVTCAGSVSAATSDATLVTVPGIVFGGAAPNCTATFTPELDENGSANLTFTLTDGSLSDAETFALTVTAVNDQPVIGAIPAQTTPEDTPFVINFTIADVDDTVTCASSVSAATSDAAIIPVSGVVFGGSIPNCTATVSPLLNTNGVLNLTFTVTDGSLSASRVFAVTVTAANDPPVVSSILAQSTAEDTPIVVGFTIMDVDSALNCATSVSAATSDSSVVAVAGVVFSGVLPNCIATITPVGDASGLTNLTFTVTDGALSDTSSFNLTVTPVNDAPVISAILPQSTPEDTPFTVNFTIDDVDNVISCTASVAAATSDASLIALGGIVFGGAYPNCTATITPELNVSGSATLDFTVTDGTASDVSTFVTTVTAANDPPILTFVGAQSTPEDTPLTINFSISDVDSVMDCTTSVSAATSDGSIVPLGGIVFGGLAPFCTATVTSLPDTFGALNLTFTVTDGSLSDFETFALSVTAVNDLPVISAIAPQTTNEDTQFAVNFNISDVDNTVDCVTSMSAATSDATIIATSGIVFSGAAPFCTATITPELHANGSLSLDFTVTDGLAPVTRTFNVNVTADNDAPTISVVAAQSTPEDTQFSFNFTIDDVDNTLTCAGSVSAASTDALIIPAGNVAVTGTYPNCTATITPIANANGALTLTLTVTDGSLSASSPFAVTVTAVNDAPIISVVGALSMNEDGVLPVGFSITDVDSPMDCSASMSASSTNTALVDTVNMVFGGAVPACTVTITPVANANGITDISLTVTDAGGLTDVETFTLTVNAVNDAPVLSAIGNRSTNEDQTLVINFTVNDIDSTLNCVTSMSAATSDASLITIGGIVFSGSYPNCTATISPVANAFGVLNLTFALTDTVDTDSETFQVTINSQNDAPVVSPIAAQAVNEDSAPLAVGFSITDVDDILDCSASMSASSSNALLVPAGNVAFSGAAPACTATLTLIPNANGVVTITLTATDGLLSTSQSFTLTVNAVNDAPTFSGVIAGQSLNEDNQHVVNFTIDDIDSVLNCNSAMSASSSTPAIINATAIVFAGAYPNCTATFTPELNANGALNLTFRVSDAEPLFSDQTFLVTVAAVNDAPTITDITDLSVNEDNATAPLAFTIGDVDSVLLCTSANVTATSSNTALVPDANLVLGGAYPNCTVTATPLADLSGSTTITMTVNDNAAPNLQGTQNFVLTVNAVNDAPTVSTIANQTINEETSTAALAFTIADLETGGALTCAGSVVATSSNQAIIPNANFVIAGTSPNCTVTATPLNNQFGGPVVVTLTVTDTGTPLPAATGTSTFDITVTNVNDAPAIDTVIADQVTNENVPVVVNFTISDIDSVLNCGTSVSAASTNAGLVPVASIVFGGAFPNCTATVTSALNQFGLSTLTFTVTDGALSHARSFLYTVNDVDQTPTMAAIGNFTLNEDNSATATQTPVPYNINLSVNDVDSTLACNSTYLSVSSSNAGLLPAGNIVFSGTVPNCIATATLVANATGVVTLTFSVTDGNSSASRNSVITVNAINDPPTISPIAGQITDKNVPITVNFTIADSEQTLICAFTGSGGSLGRTNTNQPLLPLGNMVFGGTAPNCTVTLTPATGGYGSIASVTVRVTDGIATPVPSAFGMIVNDPPTISAIGNQTFPAGVPTNIPFTIADNFYTTSGSPINCVTSMSASSSDQAVVPNGNITFSGFAPNCVATVTAATTGSANLVFTVSDGRVSASSSSTVTALSAGTVVVSPTYSTVTVTANSSINSSRALTTTGEVSTIKVTVKDTSQNTLGGGHWVVIQRGAGTSNGTLSAVTDHGDGTYTATFTGNTIGTPRTFNAYIDGYAITSTLPTIAVSSNGPNCLSRKRAGQNTSGVYFLDSDGDSGPATAYQAYCDMVTNGGGWTLAAVPRRGVAPFTESDGLLSPNTVSNARNSAVWAADSNFEFSQIRVTEDSSATSYSIANLNNSFTLTSLLAAYPVYSQQNVASGVTITSTAGSNCFIVRGKSANYGLWDDRADFLFMGFHGGTGCQTPLSEGNMWDTSNIAQQWLISGYDGLDSLDGPEAANNSVGQNSSGAPWVSQDNPTLIWFK